MEMSAFSRAIRIAMERPMPELEGINASDDRIDVWGVSYRCIAKETY